MPFALLALAISAFGIGTTEFVIMGLLPRIAHDFGISVATAGQLVSGYALGVVVGAPLLTAAAVRLPRRTMLISMMALFTVANLAAALAPSYGFLLAARVVSGLPHGAFFGIGTVVAADMAADNRRARAISRMFLGLTVANVIGVPAGTLLGQQLGWRWTFTVVSAIGLLSLIKLSTLIPHQQRTANAPLRTELAAFRSSQIWLAFAIVVFGFGGVFAAYSYITPMLTTVAGFKPGAVAVLMSVFGMGLTIGALAGGRLADRAPMATLYTFLPALAAALGMFAFTAHHRGLAIINLFVLGVTAFTAIPCIQTRILDKAAEAPGMASAGVQSAFNLANSLGASLGGLVIAVGFGLTAPSVVGAVMTAGGLVLALLSGRMERREAARSTPARGLATEPDPEAAPIAEPEPVVVAEPDPAT